VLDWGKRGFTSSQSSEDQDRIRSRATDRQPRLAMSPASPTNATNNPNNDNNNNNNNNIDSYAGHSRFEIELEVSPTKQTLETSSILKSEQTNPVRPIPLQPPLPPPPRLHHQTPRRPDLHRLLRLPARLLAGPAVPPIPTVRTKTHPFLTLPPCHNVGDNSPAGTRGKLNKRR